MTLSMTQEKLMGSPSLALGAMSVYALEQACRESWACLSDAALAFGDSELCILHEWTGRIFRALKLAAQIHLAGRQAGKPSFTHPFVHSVMHACVH